jgi:hypothetical protein
MITTLKDFIAEKKGTHPSAKVNENMDEDMPLTVDNDDADDDADDDDNVEGEENAFTLESFIAMLDAEYERINSELEEGQEAPVMLTPEQIQIVFDVVSPMMSMEPVQEGLFGPSKEEIEAGKKGAEERLKQIEANFQGKKLFFMEKGDNKQVPYTFEIAMKTAEKNKFRGVIKTFNQGDKVTLMYEPGKTLLQKLAAGTTSQTTAA